jgi:hypothetical protein
MRPGIVWPLCAAWREGEPKMDAKLKIVTQLPLRELWRDNGFTITSRARSVSESDITHLLRAGPVQFVVADVGSPLQWIQLRDCHRFWTEEIKPHLAAGSRASLDEFPGSYCYFASQWNREAEGTPIVVVEKSH